MSVRPWCAVGIGHRRAEGIPEGSLVQGFGLLDIDLSRDSSIAQTSFYQFSRFRELHNAQRMTRNFEF
ncbi:hypothetical protein [Scytonema sp. PCC 10023]|uniref:hypothetical protein n=1 Tax=Scytonema sp. PCC 10023 TaxID=1680591 RepID=UPI0039C69EB4